MAQNRSTNGQPAFLGYGIIQPFRRVGSDFQADGGEPLVKACAKQVLGTDEGELPWRRNFGSKIRKLRHRNQTAQLKELARNWAQEALTRWEPRLVVRDVEILKTLGSDRALYARVHFEILQANVPANQVVLTGQLSVDVPLGP